MPPRRTRKGTDTYISVPRDSYSEYPGDDAFSLFPFFFFTPYVDLEEEKHLLSRAGRDPAR